MASLADNGSAVFINSDKGEGQEREQREREQREREQREREQREREQREREQRERKQPRTSDGEEKNDFYYLPPLEAFREDPNRPSHISSQYDTGERMSILNTRRETMLIVTNAKNTIQRMVDPRPILIISSVPTRPTHLRKSGRFSQRWFARAFGSVSMHHTWARRGLFGSSSKFSIRTEMDI